MAAVLIAWCFPFWLGAEPTCPEWSVFYQSRTACEDAREVAELRGYETERCEVMPVPPAEGE